MRSIILAVFMVLASCQLVQGVSHCNSSSNTKAEARRVRFDQAFADSTLCLRLSYTVSPDTAYGCFSDLRLTPRWWGRRVNLDSLFMPEVLRIVVSDSASGRTIYTHSKYFSFEPQSGPVTTTVQVPMPRRAAVVTATIGGPEHHGRRGRLQATYALSTQQIAQMPLYVRDDAPEYVWLRRASVDNAGDKADVCCGGCTADEPTCHCCSQPAAVSAMTFAIVPEGFTADQMPEFLRRAAQLDSALMHEAAFARYVDRINVAAILAPSPQSGVTHPSAGIQVNTLLGAHFDSWGIERLLTMPQSSTLGDVLCGLPNTHVMIIANSPTYGGSGSGNDYCIGTLDEYSWLPVLIHELGHSFGHLADEYEGGVSEEFLGEDPADDNAQPKRRPREPMELNITNLVDFSGKWQHLIDSGEAGLIEGANYRPRGYWRGCEHCLMRAIQDQHYCAVCTDAIGRVIRYYTEPGSTGL